MQKFNATSPSFSYLGLPRSVGIVCAPGTTYKSAPSIHDLKHFIFNPYQQNNCKHFAPQYLQNHCGTIHEKTSHGLTALVGKMSKKCKK